MVRENYVSFETAKLMKVKGFDGQCYKVWAKESKSEPKLYAAPSFVEGDTTVDRESVEDGERFINDLNPSEYKVEGYLAPTLQMAVQWIQEAHNIIIVAVVIDFHEMGEKSCPCCVRIKHVQWILIHVYIVDEDIHSFIL